MSLDPTLAKIPGLGGYLAMRNYNDEQQAGQLAQAGAFQSLQEHFGAQARAEALRSEVDALPPDQRTPENIVKIGAKYADPKTLYTNAQKSVDNSGRIAATKEAAMARLTQGAQQFAMQQEIRLRQAATQEERTRIQAEAQEGLTAWRTNMMRLQRAKTADEIGEAALPPMVSMTPGAGAGPAPAAPQQPGLPANVPPSDAGAYNAVAAATAAGVPASVGVNRQMPPSETAGMQPMGGAAPAAPAPAPVAAPAEPPQQFPTDASREDYLMAQRDRAGAPQAAPEDPAPVVPQPVTQNAPTAPVAAPSATPAAPAMPQMPPSIQALPAKEQRRWIRENTPAAGEAAMGPDAIKVAAWEKLLFGTDIKGYGKATAQQRAAIANERARMGRELGLSDTEMAMMPQDNKVKMKAVDKMTTWGAFVDKASEQVTKSMDVAISYAQKLDPTTIRVVNRALLAGQREFNDPIQAGYATAIMTATREYGRLMSGPTSNAMLPVEAMKKSDDLISQAMDVPTLMEVKKVMLKDATITTDAVRNQITGLRASIVGRAAPSSDVRTPAAPSKPLSEMTTAELVEYRKKLAGQK